MNRRTVGKRYEQLAAEFLEANGCVILEKNYYSPKGEIDLILRSGGTIIFVEVKYRSSINAGYPEEAVTRVKQRAVYYTARNYLYRNQIDMETPCRFDVVSILGSKINWIKNAF